MPTPTPHGCVVLRVKAMHGQHIPNVPSPSFFSGSDKSNAMQNKVALAVVEDGGRVRLWLAARNWTHAMLAEGVKARGTDKTCLYVDSNLWDSILEARNNGSGKESDPFTTANIPLRWGEPKVALMHGRVHCPCEMRLSTDTIPVQTPDKYSTLTPSDSATPIPPVNNTTKATTPIKPTAFMLFETKEEVKNAAGLSWKGVVLTTDGVKTADFTAWGGIYLRKSMDLMTPYIVENGRMKYGEHTAWRNYGRSDSRHDGH